MTQAATQAVLDEFPGARVTATMPAPGAAPAPRAIEPMPEAPVREAVLEGLRQAYAMIVAQKSLCKPGGAASEFLTTSLEKLVSAAAEVKREITR